MAVDEQPPGADAHQADEQPSEAAATPKRGRFRGLPRWQRVLIVLGAVVVLLTGVGAAGAWALVHRYESAVTHEDLLGDAAPPKQQTQEHFDSGPLNLLLLGSDSRAGETDKGHVAGERSDTIMLVHISNNRDKATVISIPRDSYVYIPPGGPWKGGKNKLNAAFAFGGAPLAAKTITQLTGIPLDGAMIANFAGIRTMVDAVGGVNVCIPYDVKSYFSTKVWKKGCNFMDGPTAEEFMRNRMYVPGGDFGRMKDQQLVVQGIIEKVSSGGVLDNPLKFDKLLITAAQSLTVDQNLDIRKLATSVKSIRPADVKFATVPVSNDNLKTAAGSSVELDAKKAPELFAAIKGDTVDQWLAANPPAPDAP
jgi:LCP family protein required for cell wall assembly